MGERNCEECAYYTVKTKTIYGQNDCEVTTTVMARCDFPQRHVPGWECRFKEKKK